MKSGTKDSPVYNFSSKRLDLPILYQLRVQSLFLRLWSCWPIFLTPLNFPRYHTQLSTSPSAGRSLHHWYSLSDVIGGGASLLFHKPLLAFLSNLRPPSPVIDLKLLHTRSWLWTLLERASVIEKVVVSIIPELP